MHQGLVELQYVAPHSNGLFRGAISESGRVVCICGPCQCLLHFPVICLGSLLGRFMPFLTAYHCHMRNDFHSSLKEASVLEVWQQPWQLPRQLLEAWAA